MQASAPIPCSAGPGHVECDVCTGRKLKAVKSCLECRVSYCETHYKAHNELNSGRKHKGTDDTGQLQVRICTQHEKPLGTFDVWTKALSSWWTQTVRTHASDATSHSFLLWGKRLWCRRATRAKRAENVGECLILWKWGPKFRQQRPIRLLNLYYEGHIMVSACIIAAQSSQMSPVIRVLKWHFLVLGGWHYDWMTLHCYQLPITQWSPSEGIVAVRLLYIFIISTRETINTMK